MVSKDEMKSCIQEWMAQCISVEDLAKTYMTIISETELQLSYMCEQISKELVDR